MIKIQNSKHFSPHPDPLPQGRGNFSFDKLRTGYCSLLPLPPGERSEVRGIFLSTGSRQGFEHLILEFWICLEFRIWDLEFFSIEQIIRIVTHNLR
jgi:hypothetical protein